MRAQEGQKRKRREDERKASRGCEGGKDSHTCDTNHDRAVKMTKMIPTVTTTRKRRRRDGGRMKVRGRRQEAGDRSRRDRHGVEIILNELPVEL